MQFCPTNKHKFILQANDRHLLILAELLQLDASEMRSWLCHRKIVSMREVFFKPMTVDEVTGFECCAGQNLVLVYLCGS
jgi:myosin heavy subunit